MKKSGLLSTASLLVISLLFTNPVFAHGGKGFDSDRPHHRSMFHDKRHHGGPLGFVKHMMRTLDLSDEQREEIEQIVEDASPQFKDIMEAMRTEREKIHELITADTSDMAAIEAAAENQSLLIKQMIIEGAEIKSQIFTLLTPEQREEIRTQMDKRKRF